MAIDQSVIGGFVDDIAGKARTPAAVGKRLIHEVTELALEVGLSATDIFDAVRISLEKQMSKPVHYTGAFANRTAEERKAGIDDESADVSLVLKDLVHVAGVNLSDAEDRKFGKFVSLQWTVAPDGCIHSVKTPGTVK
jgi:NTP pyrophosphatase (non-canonical NTP hydrolase)